MYIVSSKNIKEIRSLLYVSPVAINFTVFDIVVILSMCVCVCALGRLGVVRVRNISNRNEYRKVENMDKFEFQSIW